MLIFVVPEGQLNASTQKGDATQSSTQSKGVFKANQVSLDTRPNLPSRRLPCVHSAKAHRARFVPLFSAECFFFFPHRHLHSLQCDHRTKSSNHLFSYLSGCHFSKYKSNVHVNRYFTLITAKHQRRVRRSGPWRFHAVLFRCLLHKHPRHCMYPEVQQTFVP